MLRRRDDHVANLQHGQNELRIQLDAMRRERDTVRKSLEAERDGIRKALEAERANRRRDRERHAALRTGLRHALKTVERVRVSRDRYRELAARTEAALLRKAPGAEPRLCSRGACAWRCARPGSSCRRGVGRRPTRRSVRRSERRAAG